MCALVRPSIVFAANEICRRGDLADRLNVSRQSVSRWETGGAVPELDKLIRMSHLFGGHAGRTGVGRGTRCGSSVPIRLCAARAAGGFQPRKVAGTVLFCMGFLTALLLSLLGGLAAGLVFASPFFLVCGDSVSCFGGGPACGAAGRCASSSISICVMEAVSRGG